MNFDFWIAVISIVYMYFSYPQLVGSRMGDPRGIDWLGSKMGPIIIVDLVCLINIDL